ncbi:MAG: hypothetical protein E5Y31_00045 [Mesorhizobium sp.]|nr:MAG: hypothetical protein E5Y31_00045 [Mesorhizobium sp.]
MTAAAGHRGRAPLGAVRPGLLPGTVVLSDDAGFHIARHALCWVHAERLNEMALSVVEGSPFQAQAALNIRSRRGWCRGGSSALKALTAFCPHDHLKLRNDPSALPDKRYQKNVRTSTEKRRVLHAPQVLLACRHRHPVKRGRLPRQFPIAFEAAARSTARGSIGLDSRSHLNSGL